MKFSIIIPAHNEEEYLPRLLDSIEVARSNYSGGRDQIEVIVGDNLSTDRTAEVAAARGARSYLIDDETEIEDAWLEGARTVGITSGASAPEWLVRAVCDWFRTRGVTDMSEHRSVYEDVVFKLPVELRRAERSAA